MSDDELLIQPENTTEINTLIDNMTLFDDDLMSKVFDENIPATELLLKIILENENIKVISVKGQYDMRNPVIGGRCIRLDIKAQDTYGNYFDVEVQRSSSGANPKRVRFHSSMLDVRMLNKGQDYKELQDSYVIFITEHDKWKANLPIYHVDRIIRETQEYVEDGSHIIYVNGSYQGNDSLGQLIHDFRCKKASEMYYSELAEGIQYFKDTEGGREIMCEAVEAYAEKRAAERAKTVEEYAEKKAAARIKEIKEGVERRTEARIKEIEENAEKRTAEKIKEVEEKAAEHAKTVEEYAERKAAERIKEAEENAERREKEIRMKGIQNTIKNLMKKLDMSFEQCLGILEISEEEQDTLRQSFFKQ